LPAILRILQSYRNMIGRFEWGDLMPAISMLAGKNRHVVTVASVELRERC